MFSHHYFLKHKSLLLRSFYQIYLFEHLLNTIETFDSGTSIFNFLVKLVSIYFYDK